MTVLDHVGVACALAGLLAGCASDPVGTHSFGLETESPSTEADRLPGCGPGLIGPYLQGIDTSSAALTWETQTIGDTWIEYGDTNAYGHVASSGTSVGLHEARLEGLEQGTTYHYRFHCGEDAGSDATFRTVDARDAAVRFTVYGDTQANPAGHRAVAEAMLEEHPAFVLHVGDQVQDGDDHGSWATEFLNPAHRLMAQVPVYAAMGNHEHHASWFFHYHSYPAPENYYSFEWGSSLVVVLDSDSDFGEGSSQQSWLRATLESKQAQTAAWVWVVFHQPAYAEGWRPCVYEGNSDVRDQLIPVLEQYGIDAIFNGHVHGYERGFQNGIHYVTTGGGGGSLDEHCTDWPTITLTEYVHNYVTVDVVDTKATIRAKRLDGSILDELTLTQRAHPVAPALDVSGSRERSATGDQDPARP